MKNLRPLEELHIFCKNTTSSNRLWMVLLDKSEKHSMELMIRKDSFVLVDCSVNNGSDTEGLEEVWKKVHDWLANTK